MSAKAAIIGAAPLERADMARVTFGLGRVMTEIDVNLKLLENEDDRHKIQELAAAIIVVETLAQQSKGIQPPTEPLSEYEQGIRALVDKFQPGFTKRGKK